MEGCQDHAPDQLHQPLPVVDGPNLAAQDPVQDLADGEGQGAGEQHEELGQPDGLGPHGQSVTGTDRLGNDLPKDDNPHGGTNDSQGSSTTSQHVQSDCQGVVHKNIAKKNGAKQKIS